MTAISLNKKNYKILLDFTVYVMYTCIMRIITCQRCGKDFPYRDCGLIKYCPDCRKLVAIERARSYKRMRRGQAKESHYPWEKMTKCICHLCAADGRPPYHQIRMEWKGRGIPIKYCTYHKMALNMGDISTEPESYQVHL